jgi:hypothetical protein
MVMKLLVAPAAMLPVSKVPAFPVAVCVMLSPLRQATVWPTFTVGGLGGGRAAGSPKRARIPFAESSLLKGVTR